MHVLGDILGLSDLLGPWYGFWSGICGDLMLFGGGYALIKKHNCHVHHCWRVGRIPYGDGYHLCHKHHPRGQLRADRLS